MPIHRLLSAIAKDERVSYLASAATQACSALGGEPEPDWRAEVRDGTTRLVLRYATGTEGLPDGSLVAELLRSGRSLGIVATDRTGRRRGSRPERARDPSKRHVYSVRLDVDVVERVRAHGDLSTVVRELLDRWWLEREASGEPDE